MLGRIIPTDEIIFFRGVGQPPTRFHFFRSIHWFAQLVCGSGWPAIRWAEPRAERTGHADSWRRGGFTKGQTSNATFFGGSTPVIGAFNYRGSGTGMGGRPDRSAQPAPGHDLEPVFVQVYVTDGPKQFLAHLAYCAFTNADTDQRANSMAMMDGPPPLPQLLAETRWEDPPSPSRLPPSHRAKTYRFWRAPADLGGWEKRTMVSTSGGFLKWWSGWFISWKIPSINGWFGGTPISGNLHTHTHIYIYSTYRYYRRYSGIIGKPIFYLKRVWARGKSHFK